MFYGKIEFEMKYYETYYLSNIIKNVVFDSFSYLRHIDDFFGGIRDIVLENKFEKYTILHRFIEHVINRLNYEDVMDKVYSETKRNFYWIHNAVQYYGIECIDFSEWLSNYGISENQVDEDIIFNYQSTIWGSIDKVTKLMTNEVFYILFQNRKFLREFNSLMSGLLELMDMDELNEEQKTNVKKNMTLKRVNIPVWVKRAVFFRDRGRCCFCSCDLTGIVNIELNRNYDHIVPLSLFGLNDPTNIQLLCEKHNSEKSDKNDHTSEKYENWW